MDVLTISVTLFTYGKLLVRTQNPSPANGRLAARRRARELTLLSGSEEVASETRPSGLDANVPAHTPSSPESGATHLSELLADVRGQA